MITVFTKFVMKIKDKRIWAWYKSYHNNKQHCVLLIEQRLRYTQPPSKILPVKLFCYINGASSKYLMIWKKCLNKQWNNIIEDIYLHKHYNSCWRLRESFFRLQFQVFFIPFLDILRGKLLTLASLIRHKIDLKTWK